MASNELYLMNPLYTSIGGWFPLPIDWDSVCEDLAESVMNSEELSPLEKSLKLVKNDDGNMAYEGDLIIADTDVDFNCRNMSIDEINEVYEAIENGNDVGQFEASYMYYNDIDSAIQYIDEFYHLCDYEYEIKNACFDVWCEYNTELINLLPYGSEAYLDIDAIVRDLADYKTFKTSNGIYYTHNV